MEYLYLDESGDLGHPIQSPGASRHFVIAVLELTSERDRKAIEKAIARTMKHKARKKQAPKKRPLTELKATTTDLATKQYFYRQVARIPFTISTVIIEKERFLNHIQLNPNRVYGFITHLALKALPLEQATTRVVLTIDRSVHSAAIPEFNDHVVKQLEIRIPPLVPLAVNHYFSHESKALQAIDLFAWGIFRKYENGDTRWYDCFKDKIVFEWLYPDK
jgi:hypothetical protein